MTLNNIKIPILFIAISIIAIALSFFTESDTVFSGLLIASTSSMLILIFVYFPLLTINMIGEKYPNKKSIINGIGLLSLLFLVTGLVFKLMQLPGASIFLVTGSTIFAFNFLPSWYLGYYKKNTRFQKILYAVFCTNLSFLVLYYQFKTMHWNGAWLFATLTNYTFLFITLPTVIFALIKKENRIALQLEHQLIFGFIVAFILGGMIGGTIVRNYYSSDNTNYINTVKNNNLYYSKSKFIYKTFTAEENKIDTNVNYATSVHLLKNLSQKTYDYIQSLKTHLVEQTDSKTITPSDTLNFNAIVNLTNYEVPTRILIGNNDYEPRKGKYSAHELKQVLLSFVDSVNHIIPESSRPSISQNNPFDFSEIPDEHGDPIPWSVAMFDHESLGNSFTKLTSLQSNVRYFEMMAVSELFNLANANNKENLAQQLADISLRYEREKQNKHIAALQKAKELDTLRILAKDEEISNREQTILFFVLAMLAFILLIAFVVRSNYLRKQTNKELAHQKQEVEKQKLLVEEKQKEVMDSINYAQRLQRAILAQPETIDKTFEDNFLLYLPKDVVAGDFYFFETNETHVFYAAADCTGHGVPGALVSVVCANALTRSVKEFKLTEPGKILDKTRELVLETFAKNKTNVKDGMDISLLSFEKNNYKELQWAGANNPLWYFSNNVLTELKADKQPVGLSDEAKPFTTHKINTAGITQLYLITDGFPDQFGGPKNKKYKYSNLKELLLTIHQQPFSQQKIILEKEFHQWKGELEQTDDVCIIGIKL